MKKSTPQLGESPWTSPRRMLGSTMVHILFLSVLAFASRWIVMPSGSNEPDVLRGELGTVDTLRGERRPRRGRSRSARRRHRA